jgi:hypothetical protein
MFIVLRAKRSIMTNKAKHAVNLGLSLEQTMRSSVIQQGPVNKDAIART